MIGKFELAFTKYKQILTEFKSRQKHYALAIAFALSTEDEMQAETFVSLIAKYWKVQRIGLEKILERLAKLQNNGIVARSALFD